MAGLLGMVRSIFRGGLPEAGIPERVRSEFRQREAESERLIGWVQLALVLFFSSLYAIAPRAEGTDGFNFVPLALGIYLLFTLVRLVLSYRIILPTWYLVVSIGVDMALLVGLIYSFHIQYNQHPTFYLKAPTLMYMFIFISLRALRFDPRFVLTTGFVAVCGWVGLVLYAVVSDMGGMRVTRNYVEYLTSNSILIGAELDKTVVIITVTAILTAALYRGRKMMMASIREQTAASDLRRFFAPEVAASITGAEDRLQAGEGVVRDAAILYVDVRNFTRTANNLPPEKVMAVLAAYQETAVAVIEREGGRVDKFLGDGILATFGAIHPSATYAADALRAALAVVVAIQDNKDLFQTAGWPGDFRIGTAVAAGPVTVGVVGAHDRLEFTVIGDAVNRAAKLEDANKQEASQALTDATTWDLAAAQGYDGLPAQDRLARPINGLAVPLDLKVLA